jgi:hypothetical protein
MAWHAACRWGREVQVVLPQGLAAGGVGCCGAKGPIPPGKYGGYRDELLVCFVVCPESGQRVERQLQ